MPQQRMPDHRRATSAVSGVTNGDTRPWPEWVRTAFVAFAICMVATTGILAFHHLKVMAAPGCGAGSPCDLAARSEWAMVPPSVGMPVAFIGLAYSIAMLAALLVAKPPYPRPLGWIARAAAIGSLVYFGIMLGAKMMCSYCTAYHTAAIALAIAMRRATRAPSSIAPRVLPVFFITALVSLAALQGSYLAFVDRQKSELAESTKRIAEATRAGEAGTVNAPNSTNGTPSAITSPNGTGPRPGSAPFEGRYRLGPEISPVRVVLYTDYQCPDCKGIEAQLEASIAAHPDLAASIKHFPMSTTCNPRLTQNYHADACFAAYAAEIAGKLGGSEAFWKMHRWLFSVNGSFDADTLRAAVTKQGLNADRFMPLMESPEIKALIASDVDEAWSRGIDHTPMIFVNGVELRGYTIPNALTQAIDAAYAARPAPATAATDSPLDAAGRAIDLWQKSPAATIPVSLFAHAFGPSNSPVQVVMFGDLNEPGTAEADTVLRAFTSGGSYQIRYAFAHFPVNTDCNSQTEVNLHPHACHAAKLLEASALVAGDNGYAAALDWILAHRATYEPEAALAGVAGAIGAQPSGLADAMSLPDVLAKIASDATFAKQLGIREIPFILINGKHARSWKIGEENLLPRLFEKARELATKP